MSGLHALTYIVDGEPGTFAGPHGALIAHMAERITALAPGYCVSAPLDELALRQIISMSQLGQRISFTISKALILRKGSDG